MEKRKRTIDLRKTRSEDIRTHTPQRESLQKPPPAPAEPSVQSPAHTSVLPDSLVWTAFEHEQIDFGSSWYMVTGGITLFFFALALFVQNYFFAVLIVIAFCTFVLFRSQPPQKISFSISKEGIRAGKTLYQLSHIKSFWIFTRPGHSELSLETSQTFSPYVRLPLGDMHQQRVREFLLALLPEQQHQQFLLDEIMRIIGF